MEGGGTHARNRRPEALAVQPGDRAHYLLPAFQRKVRRALDVIHQAHSLGRIGVCFSGGKDSTVLLDLVRRVVKSPPVGFFDSGCEYDSTYEIADRVGARRVRAKEDLWSACKRGGYWGHQVPEPVDIDFFELLVLEPARRFIEEESLLVLGLGLRAVESKGRMLSLNRKDRGELYPVAYDGTFHLCPMAFWTHDDIWAYIAGRELPYNRAYDIMAGIGVPREQQRVSYVLGGECAETGRFARIRQIDPPLFARLALDFPKVLEFV